MKTIINGLNKLKAGQQIDDADLRYRICEEAKKAVEKQIAKKPKGDYHSCPHYRCPNCQGSVKMYCDSEIFPFCGFCGQVLDWSEE